MPRAQADGAREQRFSLSPDSSSADSLQVVMACQVVACIGMAYIVMVAGKEQRFSLSPEANSPKG